MTITKEKKGKRGFASMSKEQLRKICSMGGKAAQSTGKGHKFTQDELHRGGKRGGSISRRKPKQPASDV